MPSRRSLRAITGLAAAISLAACAGDPATTETADTSDTADTTGAPPEPQLLLDHALWRTADPHDDPLAAHRPAPLECGLAGWYQERGELEVDTNYCDYADLTQPALIAIDAGSKLALTFRHYDLAAPEPAEAHIALMIGGDLIWEDHVTIPGPAAVRLESATIPRAYPAGAPVRFHLHNHGQNTWILGLVTVTAPT